MKLPSFRSASAGMIQILVVLVAVLLIAGMFGRTFWVFDLFAHFRGQYSAAFLLGGVGLLLLRSRKTGAASLAAGLALAFTLAPVPGHSVSAQNAPRLKLISFNVLKTNPHREEIRKFLETEDADVVFMTEVTAIWQEDLDRLRKNYPYQIGSSRKKSHGIVLLSKYPFLEESLNFIDKRPWAEVVVVKDGASYRVAGVHSVVPWDMASSDARNAQLLEIAARLAGQPHTILCGDLNITRFSPWFPEILAKGRLNDTALQTGFSPTWMRGMPLFSIPIDHVLISPDLALLSRSVGPALGSDHNPLVVEVAPAEPALPVASR